jgi:hypothetical protein
MSQFLDMLPLSYKQRTITMNILTDTKRLKVKLSEIRARLFFNRVIKPYNNRRDNPTYFYSIHDKQKGVFLGLHPREACMAKQYTVALSFHSYSEGSALLELIFSIVPLEQWMVSEIHVAYDFSLPYEQFHVLRPAKKATVDINRTSMYVGKPSSASCLYIYDKQVQMREVRGVHTDTWTRVEMRYNLPRMKRVSELTVEDFAAAQHHNVVTDVSLVPDQIKGVIDDLDNGRIEWGGIQKRTKEKIRECAIPQAINLYDSLLSKLEDTDISTFIYAPSKQRTSCVHQQNKRFTERSQQAASPSVVLIQPNKSSEVADDLASVTNPLPLTVVHSVCNDKMVQAAPSFIDLVTFLRGKDVNHDFICKDDFRRHTLDGIPVDNHRVTSKRGINRILPKDGIMNLPSSLNQTFDVKPSECITPLPFLFLKGFVLHPHLNTGINRRRSTPFRSNSVSAGSPPRQYAHYYCDSG